MFDLAWSEIALIGVVALVVIGPKDLPEAIRGLARGVQKLRRMASEFQGQADELVREANLEEVRSSINEIRNFNIRDTLEKAVDTDGTIRRTFTEDPLKTDYTSPYTSPVATAPPGATDGASAEPGSAEGAAPVAPATPAFIPPAYAPPAPPAATPSPVAAAEPPAPPSFVPPPAFVAPEAVPVDAPAQTQKS
jgi:sec-independent protein translocase protein TatB